MSVRISVIFAYLYVCPPFRHICIPACLSTFEANWGKAEGLLNSVGLCVVQKMRTSRKQREKEEKVCCIEKIYWASLKWILFHIKYKLAMCFSSEDTRGTITCCGDNAGPPVTATNRYTVHPLLLQLSEVMYTCSDGWMVGGVLLQCFFRPFS